MITLGVKNGGLRITLTFLVFGVLWILISDQLLNYLVKDNNWIIRLSLIKGWLFVIFTGLLIYCMSKRYLQELSISNEKLLASYEELSSTHEELAASEEELRQQFEELLFNDEKIRMQNAILLTLHETTLGIIGQLNLEALLQNIITRATTLVGSEDGFITLLNDEEGVINVKVGLGVFSSQVGKFKLEPEKGLVGRVIKTGRAIVIEDYQRWDERVKVEPFNTVNTMMQVPLKRQSKIIGTLGLAYLDDCKKFDVELIEAISQFAELASIALENANLHAAAKYELEERKKRETTLSEIFNSVNDAIMVHDEQTSEILSFNNKAIELIGHAGIASNSFEWVMRTKVEGPELFEWGLEKSDGTKLYMEVNLRFAKINGRRCILSVLRDLTERKKIEFQLANSETQKIAILNAIPDLMIRVNWQGVILDYSKPAGYDIYLDHNMSVGMNLFQVFSEEIATKYISFIEIAIESQKTEFYEYQLVKQDKIYHFEARIVKNGIDEVLCIIRDTTENRQMAEKLNFISYHDALTGVFNRAYFEKVTLRLRSKNMHNTGIVICDVDGLKLINDTLGHRHGDEILKAVADILSSCASPGNVVARIGGDEFAVLILETNQNEMENLSKKIRHMADKYNYEQANLHLSLSIGWACNYNDFESLFKEADNNMYRVKIHQSQSSRSAIVQTLMKALEARDFITEGHADRLQDIVVEIAQRLDLSDQKIADLRLLAQFHDIGKVGIPDSILFKPGNLTPEEVTIMRGHCEIGFRIARASPDLAPIADWILRHHEWWNGQGYPLGLAGEEIPLECRILALADAYDAMINNRVYRKALTGQTALAELRRCAGSQFDPYLTELFTSLLELRLSS